MSDVTKSELLINALLDGQLDAATADHVQQQIANDSKMREIFNAFSEQRAAIVGLPKFRLEDDFADRVLDIAAAEAAAVPCFSPPPAQSPQSPLSVDWKKYAMSLSAIAALLMAMLVYQWKPPFNENSQAAALLKTDAQLPRHSPQKSAANPATQRNLNKNATARPLADTAAVAIAGGDEFSGTSADERAPDHKLAESLASVSNPATVKPVPRTRQPHNHVASSAETKNAIAANTTAAPASVDGSVDPVAGKTIPADFALSGTAMTPPIVSPPPAIEQVWLLEVDDSFSQEQIIKALVANSISVPLELQRRGARAARIGSPNEVDGIHVLANKSQMKRALSLLASSEAVTISAFQLPNIGVQDVVDSFASKPTDKNALAAAPASIIAPPQAIAQKLHGNFFAPPSPSSKIPESYIELEQMMGLDAQAKHGQSTTESMPLMGDQPYVNAPPTDDEAIAAAKIEQNAQIDALFPQNELESEELKNFLILIKNDTPTK